VMDRFRTTATPRDLVVDEDSGGQRLERPRSARRGSQRQPATDACLVESCVSPTFSTTSTIDDNEDDDEEFPAILGDSIPPASSSVHVLQAGPTSPPDNLMLTSAAVDRRSRSSSRSPISTTAASDGLCLVNLAEARQRVLDRYDRKQRAPSSVSRCQNTEEDAQRSNFIGAGLDDCGAHRRRQQRLEPLTTVNVQSSSTFSVQHHR